MSAFFAIFSAFLYGLTNVLTRIALPYGSTSAGAFISLVSCFSAALALSVFTTSLNQYMNKGFFMFLAAGIIGPFFGRLFLYKGIERVGAAISSTLYEDKPLFSVLAAVLILGERLTLAVLLGVLLMMAGTIIVSLERSGGKIDRHWSKRDLLFPLAAGGCYGISHVFRKIGLNISPTPMVGVMVQNIGAIASIPLLTFSGRSWGQILSRSKVAWGVFSLVGLLQITAQWSLFKALEFGTVVIVSPLSSMSTFFVLLLTLIFLRAQERITLKILVGAIFMVGATVILTTRA